MPPSCLLACVMTRPDPATRRRNRALVEMALGAESKGSSHWQSANFLLDLDTGCWGDTQHITHHCKGIFCCANGIKETKLKVYTTVLASRRGSSGMT